ncbi:hypothetical protein ACF0H5_006853 [Mactra antiquata]
MEISFILLLAALSSCQCYNVNQHECLVVHTADIGLKCTLRGKGIYATDRSLKGVSWISFTGDDVEATIDLRGSDTTGVKTVRVDVEGFPCKRIMVEKHITVYVQGKLCFTSLPLETTASASTTNGNNGDLDGNDHGDGKMKTIIIIVVLAGTLIHIFVKRLPEPTCQPRQLQRQLRRSNRNRRPPQRYNVSSF